VKRRSVLAAAGGLIPAATPAVVRPRAGGARSAVLPAADARSPEVDAIVNRLVGRGAVPGGAVLVTWGGEVVHEAGYGLADVAKGTPITPQHVFHIGSVGKNFTAVGIMLLKEQGLLSYDAPLGTYLPELARLGSPVTIRRLLNHTAGMPSYDEPGALQDALFAKTDTPGNGDLLAALATAGRLRFTPGTAFEYSNTGYDALGLVIERVSGQTYREFTQRRIFGPLKMTRSFALPDDSRLTNPLVPHAYEGTSAPFTTYDSDPVDNLSGSGSVYSTVEDLSLYDRALRGESLLKQSTLADAFTSGRLNDGSETGYGFAWFVGDDYYGEPYQEHGGAWLGFRSAMLRVPGSDLTVIALMNGARYDDTETLVFDIADVFMSDGGG
jgi:CubicO group peptidase (beta-lactamase class C family)